jgi:long-subunit fatty acid transport protein
MTVSETSAFLVQILLPAGDTAAQTGKRLNDTQEELMAAFGGVTAYVQTPARGQWADEQGATATDRVFLVEVVTSNFDRSWWHAYAARLARRFEQDIVHVRAVRVELLDPASA